MKRFLSAAVALLLSTALAFGQSSVVIKSNGLTVGPSNPLPVTTSTDAAGAAITPVVSSAAESGHVLKASAGSLYGLNVTTGASAGYVLIFDATSAPSNGAVTPKKCYYVPSVSTLGASWDVPAAFATGITVVFSTTGCFTKTASATAFFSGEVK